MKKSEMTKKDIRYLLFRIRTEAEGATKAPPLPRGFKKGFEEQEHFDGWERFGITWDVIPADPWTTYRREKSLLQEHEEEMLAKVPVLPSLLGSRGLDEEKEKVKNGRQSHLRPVN
jgi:hypothetical protein